MIPSSKSNNPLMSFMRQPKIYIRLPSNGEYWPPGALAISETEDYPVYSMTAKDELLLKVPDAILNGQAVVDVIQNCMPNIKNAWMTPSVDLDAILIAIRIATYGERMSTPVNLPSEINLDYEVDLRLVLDNLYQTITWDPIIPVTQELTVYVKPLNYKQISDSSVKSFETQKILMLANDENLSQDQKVEMFQKTFSKLTDVTIGVVKDSIFRIDTPEGSVEDPRFIKEFVDNIDKDMFNVIQNHLDKLKDTNVIKPIEIETPEQIKQQGYTQPTITVPLVFDPSTFFA